jgi:hypothetical protein
MTRTPASTKALLVAEPRRLASASGPLRRYQIARLRFDARTAAVRAREGG